MNSPEKPNAASSLSYEQKVWKAEHELILAVHKGIEERRIDGDIQCWLDALQDLYAGQDVVMFETAKGGRGRVL